MKPVDPSPTPLPLLLLSQLLVLQMVMELQSVSPSIIPPMLQLPPLARLITPLVWLINCILIVYPCFRTPYSSASARSTESTTIGWI
uniref:Uncharacterized protein n=2 Tax=Picea TaxID=3328 RepID=A0A101LXS2_PICGL|nr:hypothetical protein ABT39_MTgene5474 [Picea glauca]QHR91536.1 hypothetical protein Q903MT_gene5571 [Picea sitchensis]